MATTGVDSINTVVAMRRGGQMVLPGSGVQLSLGDEILFLVEDPRVLEWLQRTLQPEQGNAEEIGAGERGGDGTTGSD